MTQKPNPGHYVRSYTIPNRYVAFDPEARGSLVIWFFQINMRIAFAFVLITFALCSRSSSTSVHPDSSSIWPLAVGNWWIGEVTSYDGTGSPIGKRSDTISIDSSRVVNGETWYYAKQMWCDGPEIVRAFANRAAGVYVADSDVAHATLFLKYPCAIHDTFDYEIEHPAPRQTKWWGRTVQDTSVRIGVNGSSVPCVEYRIISGFWSFDHGGDIVTPSEFYALGIGPVMCGYFNSRGENPATDTRQDVWRLVSYKLK